MAKKAVLQLMAVQAKNIDVLNQSFIHTADVDNSNVFVKEDASIAEGEGEVFTVSAPATGSLQGLWMAYSPEDNIVTNELGEQFKIGDLDPRAFTNKKGLVFGGFKPQVGDRIVVSEDGISGTADDYVVAVDGAMKLAFAEAASTTALCFKVEKAHYLSIADGSLGSQRTKAYVLECVNN